MTPCGLACSSAIVGALSRYEIGVHEIASASYSSCSAPVIHFAHATGITMEETVMTGLRSSDLAFCVVSVRVLNANGTESRRKPGHERARKDDRSVDRLSFCSAWVFNVASMMPTSVVGVSTRGCVVLTPAAQSAT